MSQQPPNIIQIVVDDMGVGDLAHVNGGLSTTPVLDQLFTDSTRVSQCYSGSPVCAPARAALLTGRYPHRTGAIDTMEARGSDRISLAERTLADELLDAGYATGLVGKWHSGAFDPRFHPTSRGFQEFTGFQGGWQDYWGWSIQKGGTRLASDGRHLTDVFTAEALDFVARHAHHPFYLHLSYNAPHYPLQAPMDLVEAFLDGTRTTAVATIYAMIHMVDSGIGALLEQLDDLGLAEHTVVMFTSDNGPEFNGIAEAATHRPNAGLRGSKTFVYEGGIRVPLAVRWPGGLNPGTSIDELIHFTDLLPTILEMVGRQPTGLPLDGVSALGTLRGQAVSSPPRYWQWTRYTPLAESNAAVRDGDWKLVWPAWPGTLDALDVDMRRDSEVKLLEMLDRLDDSAVPVLERPADAAPMLFDLRTDPFETTDLSAREPHLTRALRESLENWFLDVEASRLDSGLPHPRV